jgi:hypothetical protein
MITTDTLSGSAPIEQATLPVRLADLTVVEAPPLIQVYISSRAGFGAHGLLKTFSRGGFHVLTSLPLPLWGAVEIGLAHCRAVLGEVVYCVKRSRTYQVGIIPFSFQEPKIAIGGLAVIHALEKPFTLTRGHVLDIGNRHLSIFCKTRLEPGARVRIESTGWMLFGSVESVVATSMLASCLGVRLEAALFAGLSAPVAVERSQRSCYEDQGQPVDRKDQK